ncbi:putative MFS family arabinose efflux permease [Nonomuraea polychroma]|uniref:Tetracycline resistance protein n=1 Tax=Nonomuraea polychroma TaxID=46176 RepID=A0A438M5Q6_9ACTN|nr:MFS transporter [Nonomuraea polychroma]RVX40733.1 putative MFS family arabinose efflux permease [Nonomuraea polychroma]
MTSRLVDRASAKAAVSVGAVSAAIRLGTLFGPAVFGVTAAGVALPEVALALRAGPAVAWVLTVHALALGIGTAVFGRLADSWGVRAALAVGSFVLAAGTLACFAAPNLGLLIAGRLVLAAGSGAMTSCALALLAAADTAERPKLLATYGGIMAIFAAGATLAGGIATTWLSWRVTLVLPALSLLAVPFCVPLATRRGSRRPIDAIGAALLTLAVSSLVLLIQSQALSLPLGAVAAIGGVVALCALGLNRRVRRRPEGFVPLPVATDAGFWLAALIGTGVYGGLFAMMYAAPQILGKTYGWAVLSIGFALLPGAVLGAVSSRRASRLGTVTSRRLLAGVAAATAAAMAIAGTAGGGPYILVAATSLALASFAVTQVVITGEMSARLPIPRRGAGMGLLNLTFFVGGGIGSAVAGALAPWMGLPGSVAATACFPLIAAVVALTRVRPPRQ